MNTDEMPLLEKDEHKNVLTGVVIKQNLIFIFLCSLVFFLGHDNDLLSQTSTQPLEKSSNKQIGHGSLQIFLKVIEKGYFHPYKTIESKR